MIRRYLAEVAKTYYYENRFKWRMRYEWIEVDRRWR